MTKTHTKDTETRFPDVVGVFWTAQKTPHELTVAIYLLKVRRDRLIPLQIDGRELPGKNERAAGGWRHSAVRTLLLTRAC